MRARQVIERAKVLSADPLKLSSICVFISFFIVLLLFNSIHKPQSRHGCYWREKRLCNFVTMEEIEIGLQELVWLNL